jgi:hypothetical protein
LWGGPLKTINRINTVLERLKLKRNNYFRRASFMAALSILLISFQNCSQGKFEIDEAQLSSLSNDAGAQDSGAGGGGTGGGAGGEGTGGEGTGGGEPGAPAGPTQAAINAEIAKTAKM